MTPITAQDLSDLGIVATEAQAEAVTRLAAERDAEKMPDEVAAQLAAMDAAEDAV